MATAQSNDLGWQLANTLYAAGKVALAKPETPVGKVAYATELPMYPAAGVADVSIAVELTKANQAMMSVRGEEVPTLESIAIGKAVELGKLGINNNINLLRNVVKPFVGKICERVLDDVNRTPSQFKSNYEIVQRRPCPLIKSPAFMELVLRYDTREGYIPPASQPVGTIGFPVLSNNEIIELMKSAFSAGVAEQLFSKMADYLNNDVDLVDIYRKFYSEAGSGDTINKRTTTADLLRSSTPDDVAIALLIAIGMLKEPVEGVRATIDELQNYLEKLAYIYAPAVRANFQAMEAATNAGRLIIELDTAGNRIVVDSEVYDIWVTDETLAGQPDALLGILAKGHSARSLKEVVDIQDEMATYWAKVTTLDIRTHQHEQFSNMQRSIDVNVRTLLTQEIETIKPMIDSFDNCMSRVITGIRQLTINDLDRINDAVMSIVTQAIFYRTDAYFFFNTLSSFGKTNPTMQYQEAENMAVIECVGRWIANQLKVVSKTDPAVVINGVHPRW